MEWQVSIKGSNVEIKGLEINHEDVPTVNFCPTTAPFFYDDYSNGFERGVAVQIVYEAFKATEM